MRIFHVAFVALPLLFSGCKKEEPEISTIEIVSVQKVTLCTFEVVIISEIHDMGLNPVVTFEDLTESSVEEVVFTPDLMRNYRQTDTLLYTIKKLNHNFRVRAMLMKGNKPVTTSEAVINSKPVSFDVSIWPDSRFADPAQNIALKLSNNQHFSLIIDYTSYYPVKSVEVKLNRSIPLLHEIYPRYFPENSSQTGGWVYLNDQVSEGIYDVYLYIDSVEFKAKERIEVMKDHWTLINSTFPGSEKYEYSTYTDEDNLYLTGGRYSAFYDWIPKVWKYNFTLDEWYALNDFPVQNNEIFSASMGYQGAWYVASADGSKNDSTVLWKYDLSHDSWQRVTTCPGKGDHPACFMLLGKFFAGGGRSVQDVSITTCYDFWSYDLSTRKWSRLRDLPLDNPFPYMISCTAGNMAYVYSFDNKFRSYDPATDTWSLMSTFPGPDRYRANLASLGNKIYLAGSEDYNGLSLSDCWAYDIQAKTWELESFIPSWSITGFAVPFQNSLVTGLGYSGLNDPKLYRLTP